MDINYKLSGQAAERGRRGGRQEETDKRRQRRGDSEEETGKRRLARGDRKEETEKGRQRGEYISKRDGEFEVGEKT